MNSFIKDINKLTTKESSSHINELYVMCEKCNNTCNSIHFQRNFVNWTSGDNDIDKFIQDTQLSAHDNTEEALEFIPYNRFYDIKYIAKGKFGKIYRANWIDGRILYWDHHNESWKRNYQNMFVNLETLNNSKNLTLNFMNEVKIDSEFYGITQDPETKNLYYMVLNNKCKKCNFICNAIHLQRNFENWTSGDNYIDNFIQDIQLSDHTKYGVLDILEWIPYNRLYNVKHILESRFGEIHKANWYDGYLWYWDCENHNWKRKYQNMIVELKDLNKSKNITLEFMNEIKIDYVVYGITQDPETKNYMMVLNTKCKKCNSICNAMHFQQNFDNWTSGDNDIDKLIQDAQLSAHDNVEGTLEWIPNDRFYNIKHILESSSVKTYKANWIDGYIWNWDYVNQNWRRKNYPKLIVILKSLNKSKHIKLEIMNEVNRIYGITQEPITKNYMMVLNDKCKKCNHVCNAIYFQNNFENWTSGDHDIDKAIQETQLSDHNYASKALEWIPFDRFYNIRHISESMFGKMVYKANWYDGHIINYWVNSNDIKRTNQNMIVYLNDLNSPKHITLEFINEVKIGYKFYGITQDPETMNYMIVLNNKCKKCNCVCYAILFQQNFDNWTSGNSDIDKFIQDTQLLVHNNVEAVLEWIPYDKFYNIEYISEIKIYKANWYDGNIHSWNYENGNWSRKNQNVVVILKSFNNSISIVSEFINKFKIDYEIYGITQNPETKNYMIVFNNKCKKCNCMYDALHFQQNFENWTSGNKDIDKIIQNTQISSMRCNNYEGVYKKVLEWIPYNKFYDIKYIAKGGFSKVYRANWIDGRIHKWNDESKSWQRYNENMFVILKSFNNSEIITSEFVNEFVLHNKKKIDNNFNIELYGMTQDPKTKNYMMVLDYAENGSLRNYLDKEYSKLNWNKKVVYIYNIISRLKNIHEKGLIHRDLHIGNILKLKYDDTTITDIGLCKPANYIVSENAENEIYGVLPYMAPELLRGRNYTKATDIFSFGIIMYEIVSGLPPYYDLSHDNDLAIKICQGLRPCFSGIEVPQLIVQLIKKCLDANPLYRPEAHEIFKILQDWCSSDQSEIGKQIKEAEEINNTLPAISLSYETHSKAVYTSRLLNLNNLPEPKNSDDYFKQNDNITSIEFSGIN
ncbi:Ypk1p [Rhizophagus irregularis DAOM 197198w]|uniref:Ypk1p n=1 Tax=Rhizophagus irregularis (strain DAOM 197198w) TaxID=1432141 RepID=A0A015JE22_RHIIW|nr:Ypk1p [Rhizophagus irregularis DAOM 197198w]